MSGSVEETQTLYIGLARRTRALQAMGQLDKICIHFLLPPSLIRQTRRLPTTTVIPGNSGCLNTNLASKTMAELSGCWHHHPRLERCRGGTGEVMCVWSRWPSGEGEQQPCPPRKAWGTCGCSVRRDAQRQGMESVHLGFGRDIIPDLF